MENLTELQLRQIERLKDLGVEVPSSPIIATIENTKTVVGKYGDEGEKINFVIDGVSEKDSGKFDVLRIGVSDEKGGDGRLWPVYPSDAVERIKAKRRKDKTAKNVRLTESWGGLEKFIADDEKRINNEMREPTEPYSIRARTYRLLCKKGKIKPVVNVAFTKSIKQRKQ